jgi:ubiquitin-protein ligase E3 A
MQNALVRHLFLGEEPFLIMRVRRSNLLDDTVMALRSMSPASFKKPMKVVFEGEEGLDAGGVTKEFFQLLSHRLFDPAFGMFVTMPETNDTWFNLSSPRDADRDFELIGGLLILSFLLFVYLLSLFVRALRCTQGRW